MHLTLFLLARARVLFDAGASVAEVHEAFSVPTAAAAPTGGAPSALSTGLARVGTLVAQLEAERADPAWPPPEVWHPAGTPAPEPDLRAQLAAAITQIATLKGDAPAGAGRRDDAVSAW